MNEKFAKKNAARREKLMTADVAKLEKEIYKLISKTDGAFGAFVYEGQMYATFPPDDMDFAYRLIAAQVHCLSEAYEKSPTVIMAEVNGAIKDVMK